MRINLCMSLSIERNHLNCFKTIFINRLYLVKQILMSMIMAAKKFDYARPVFLVDGARTPFIKARGRPGDFTHSQLAIAAAQNLLLRVLIEPKEIDEVILGSAMPSASEANIARVVSLNLGIPHSVPAYTVHRNCASGMQSIDSAALQIASGRSNIILAGGVEAMSHAPLLFSDRYLHWLADLQSTKLIKDKFKVISQFRPSMLKPVIAILQGLKDPVVNLTMGQTAEKIAHRFGITRDKMDEFAMQSHLKLAKAQVENSMDEIIPIYNKDGHCFQNDDGVRPNSNKQDLSRLKPVFERPAGLITAGNSAQITDGAAWTLLASEDAVNQFNLPILAQITTTQWAGLDPSEMGLGPAHAIAPLLRSRRLSAKSIDYWEINEAFAAQVLAVLEALKSKSYCHDILNLKSPIGEIDSSKLNIYGGGISMGHPVGASGTRIVLQLAHILKRKNAKRGIASLCIGGGQGGAMLLERV